MTYWWCSVASSQPNSLWKVPCDRWHPWLWTPSVGWKCIEKWKSYKDANMRIDVVPQHKHTQHVHYLYILGVDYTWRMNVSGCHVKSIQRFWFRKVACWRGYSWLYFMAFACKWIYKWQSDRDANMEKWYTAILPNLRHRKFVIPWLFFFKCQEW